MPCPTFFQTTKEQTTFISTNGTQRRLLYNVTLLYRIPVGGAAGEFSFPGPTFCADSYFGTRFTSVLPQYQIKDPGHSAKSAGGRLHRMH